MYFLKIKYNFEFKIYYFIYNFFKKNFSYGSYFLSVFHSLSYYFHSYFILNGTLEINNQQFTQGDFLIIDNEDNLELVTKNNARVYGISKDSIESHLKFKKKYKIKFDLLSDVKLFVIKKYGVWGKKSFLGKKFMGIVRTTFLINSKGKIHKIWSNVRVKDHAKEVLKELKKIS